MRSILTGLLSVTVLLLSSCSSSPQPSSAPKEQTAQKPAPPRPRDETQRFPMDGRVDTEVVGDHLMGKDFMPGGTLAHYKKGSKQYDMFVARTASPDEAAMILPDWRKALTGSKLVPSFGGYFGNDGERPVFVFSRGAWIAGIAGLPEKDADLQARTLASRLN